MRVWFVVTILHIYSADAFFYVYPKIELGPIESGDTGNPLFLTPYVESGNISKGRYLARVPLTDRYHIESYAGFFTVSKTYDSNQFFWYFPAMSGNACNAPVIVWLQGGPGSSSLYGLFFEHGPLKIHKHRFKKRRFTWNQNHHMIYIDNPVGTGFSFTKDPKGYCTNETQIGEQLYSTVYQFFQLFPELQNNKFYVAGESYGGKYAPALAYTIHKKNPSAKVKINLKGLAMGNGLTDPQHQIVYGKYFYQLGLIDYNQLKIFQNQEAKLVNLIKKNKWKEATKMVLKIMAGEKEGDTNTLLYNMTGFHFNFNFLHTKDPDDFGGLGYILQKRKFRKSIHVGNLDFNSGEEVFKHLAQDMMKSVAPWVSELLNNYSICVYNGQLDMIVPYVSTVNYLRKLKFTGADEYKTACRHIWKVDDEVAGYVKNAGRLMEVMVRNAGHMMPLDQPKWALDLITRFTHELSFP